MDILRGLQAVLPKHRGGVLTIGNFDGVHLGHQKILEAVREESAALSGAPAIAMTFDPHPVKVLAPERELVLLTPSDAKARLLGRYGMDAVLFVEFTRELARLSAEEFIDEYLVQGLGVRALVVGHGYAFGRGKTGTTELLRRAGRKAGFTVRVVREAVSEGKPVSSSRIRQIILNGNVAKAARLLGRPYSMRGRVVAGAGRGTPLLKIPTANITTPYEAVPGDGVYVVRVMIDGSTPLDGVASIGNNPTFPGAERSYEVHLLDFGGDLRGSELKVIFIERLRDQERFPSVEALVARINDDIARARDILEGA